MSGYRVHFEDWVSFKEVNAGDLAFVSHGRTVKAPCGPLIKWIRWAVMVLGSEWASRSAPAQHLPLKWIDPKPNGTPAHEIEHRLADMRAAADKVLAKWRPLEEALRRPVADEEPVRLGSIEFVWDDQHKGYTFRDPGSDLPPVMAPEMAAEFAAIILRDVATRDTDPRYYFPALPTHQPTAWIGNALDRQAAATLPWENEVEANLAGAGDDLALLHGLLRSLREVLQTEIPLPPATVPVSQALRPLVDLILAQFAEAGIPAEDLRQASSAAAFAQLEAKQAEIRQALLALHEQWKEKTVLALEATLANLLTEKDQVQAARQELHQQAEQLETQREAIEVYARQVGAERDNLQEDRQLLALGWEDLAEKERLLKLKQAQMEEQEKRLLKLKQEAGSQSVSQILAGYKGARTK